MGWPFSTAPAPTFDTGLMAVPTGLTVVTAGSPWLMGMTFANPTAAAINVTVTNTAGLALLPAMEIPAGLTISIEFAFQPAVGLKWLASGAGLNGQIWGYV